MLDGRPENEPGYAGAKENECDRSYSYQHAPKLQHVLFIGKYFLQCCDSRQLTRKKLRVTAVFEEKLQVFCVETELPQRPADSGGSGVIGGWPRPALVAALVFELKETAVLEIQSGFIELGVDDVTNRVLPCEVRQHEGFVQKLLR